MKNTTHFVRKETTRAAKADSVPLVSKDPLDSWGDLDPESFGGTDFPPLATQEELDALNRVYLENPVLVSGKPIITESIWFKGEGLATGFKKDIPWIQTYSGRRFNPTDPNPEAIVIQDIAHALSNICRFTGHCSSFYSVAQHSVMVSYICNQENALYGLLHDGAEAFCQDIASPIKKTIEFAAYRQVEKRIQDAVYKRFGLSENEPADVKRADLLLLATESRDLMSPLRHDWNLDIRPLPFKIVPLLPNEAKVLFLERFTELTS